MSRHAEHQDDQIPASYRGREEASGTCVRERRSVRNVHLDLACQVGGRPKGTRSSKASWSREAEESVGSNWSDHERFEMEKSRCP